MGWKSAIKKEAKSWGKSFKQVASTLANPRKKKTWKKK